MPFTRTTALKARWRKGGLHRAAFWRKLGFPQLAKGRETMARRKLERDLAKQRESELASNKSLLESTREDNY